MTLIWLITSYKSEKIELIRSFKNCIIHISMQKVATILRFNFRLVKSYKSFRIRLPLEILRNFSKPFSEAATGGVPQNVFFKHFKIFSGKQLFWGLFFNKVAVHQSFNFIKT